MNFSYRLRNARRWQRIITMSRNKSTYDTGSWINDSMYNQSMEAATQ